MAMDGGRGLRRGAGGMTREFGAGGNDKRGFV